MPSEKRKLSVENDGYDNKENIIQLAASSGGELSKKKLADRTNQRSADSKMMKEEKIKIEPSDVSPYFNQTPVDAPSPKKSKWQPPNWFEQLQRIRDMRSSMSAPVDTMGCDSLSNLDPTLSPKTKRFHTLVSLMLSAQTKDEVTAKATIELAKLPLNVDTILKTEEDVIAKAIYPVSFYKVRESNVQIKD